MKVKMKKSLLVIFLSGISWGTYAATLEECTKLLPDGHEYKVEITFDVDKRESTPIVTGSFGVTGDTDSPENFDIGAFVECAGPLIKRVDEEKAESNNSQ